MPTAFSGVQVLAGLYFVVTSRCRGSTGVATGSAEIDVAEPEYEIAGVEDDLAHGLFVGQAVDAADEFDIRRAPGRIRPDEFLVLAHREFRI